MELHWLFVFSITCIGSVGAVDLSDFSNDLATDLGPLLALFGDNMTKQYLSESTTWLDYFIFAMAPIGIVTAMVSAIRLCGHVALRAFIGRSQEGKAVVEAELCTSTSQDVCELFTQGGIARVLGRPRILELVSSPLPPEQQSQKQGDSAGLHLSSAYFHDPDENEWKKDGEGTLAPSPNLSLNVGIKRPPTWIFYAVACIGAVLQTGVLAFAGVCVWMLHWSLIESGNIAAKNYAPAMYIIGTVLMCTGMWICAFLIGETTTEVRYRRIKKGEDVSSRLIWLQPGPQVIGDQSFDPFAYFEKPGKDSVQVWSSSSKNGTNKFELYTPFAAAIVLVGYIMQFIGLRGMVAWVALAQLGVTVVMCILRGALRMQRLNRDSNVVPHETDIFTRHELDWLAIKIACQDFKFCKENNKEKNDIEEEKLNWRVIRPKKAIEIHSVELREASTEADSEISQNTYDDPQSTRSGMVKAALRRRLRLAHLTGHFSLTTLEGECFQQWDDTHIRVRRKAKQIAGAISSMATHLFPYHEGLGNLSLQIQARALMKPERVSEEIIGVTLSPPPGYDRTKWRIDSAKIEAILGLWLWSSNTKSETEAKLLKETGNLYSNCLMHRIVSTRANDQTGKASFDVQNDMDLWMGQNEVNFLDGRISLNGPDHCGLDSNLFLAEGRGTQKESTVWSTSHHDTTQITRLCGWCNVMAALPLTTEYETDRDEVQTNTDESGESCTTLKVQYAELAYSGLTILDIYAQELLTMLLLSMVKLAVDKGYKVGEASVIRSGSPLKRENQLVTAYVDAFTKNDLGTYKDAILCIVPALRHYFPLLEPHELLDSILKTADWYRQKEEWERAEAILRKACERFATSPDIFLGNETCRAMIFRATGELYRWSLVQDHKEKRSLFGRDGIKWMTTSFKNISNEHSEVQEIFRCYTYLVKGLGSIDMSSLIGFHTPLKEYVDHQSRSDALSFITCPKKRRIRKFTLENALIPAAQNNWYEFVSSILEMGVDPDKTDKDNRTAVSYCSEAGHIMCIKVLIEHGASLDIREANFGNSTPLIRAAKNGHAEVVKMLLQSGRAAIETKDSHDRTALSWACQKGHTSVIETLLQFKANIETTDNGKSPEGYTPLWYAVLSNHPQVVQQLLEAGAALHRKHPLTNYTPLMGAIREDCDEAYHELVRFPPNKLDLDASDKNGMTALHLACERGRKDIVAKLLVLGQLRLGAKSENPCLETPLMLAIKNSHVDVVKVLLISRTYYDYHIELCGDNPKALKMAEGIGNENIIKKLREAKEAED
ncbi:hypothetical protein P280DRAFT_435040 [Massarina eburnea CBS 473.64]|uniref:Uncharacterized protein n=1 Tax=Massarina eburnea CBS 473.64 TaxID=1395130 RepID=A0A6A6RJT3_9PLEO|nr:hypothetical protein P280DRAFT_461837 [Massarina eburnea CBS 473.64]KAF2636740.1 hypothetical protein P280DRAFT_435040 [Massarina eburnea CBS 473.64]